MNRYVQVKINIPKDDYDGFAEFVSRTPSIPSVSGMIYEGFKRYLIVASEREKETANAEPIETGGVDDKEANKETDEITSTETIQN